MTDELFEGALPGLMEAYAHRPLRMGAAMISWLLFEIDRDGFWRVA